YNIHGALGRLFWLRYYHQSGQTPPSHNGPGRIALTSTATCPTGFGWSNGTRPAPPDLGPIKTDFGLARSGYTSADDALRALIDNGNTTDLVAYINESSSADALTVRATLLNISPYVSETVLRAVASAGLFTNAMLV